MKKRFKKINVEVSNVCNLKCSFCPEVVRDKKMMSLELFEKIVEQVAPITEQVCFHLMGDPLVHPQLKELIEICHRYHAKVFFVTNGVLLREEKSELLFHPVIDQVCFSLHSFIDNFPNEDPTSYLNKIFSFTDRALKIRPELYINFRLWNLEDLRGLGEKNKYFLSQIEKHYEFKISGQIDVRKSKGFKIRGRLYLHFDTEFNWPSLDLPLLSQTGSCYGLDSHFGILADGTVVPCCLDKEGSIVLGKIQDQPIEEILNSPRALAMSKGFNQGVLVEELCKRCQYIERFGSGM